MPNPLKRAPSGFIHARLLYHTLSSVRIPFPCPTSQAVVQYRPRSNLQTQALDALLERAAEKDPGFDLYWFAVALNRAVEWPDEPGRWPVKMLLDWDPRLLKETFETMAVEMMGRATAAGGPWQTATNQDNPRGGIQT